MALSEEDLAPAPDILELFRSYDTLYFGSTLGAVVVEWSSKRMTLCAGVCSYEGKGGLCRIRLSSPLLRYRSVKQLKETLLHEMIHAFLFVTANNRDHNDHGPQFQSHMRRINQSGRDGHDVGDPFRPAEGYSITIYHSFHDEVDLYRIHWWQCNKCGHVVKRAMNRAPSEKDCPHQRRRTPAAPSCVSCPWHSHRLACSGEFIKIREPTTQNRRLRPIDHYFTKSDSAGAKRQRMACPLCAHTFEHGTSNAGVNVHIDQCLAQKDRHSPGGRPRI